MALAAPLVLRGAGAPAVAQTTLPGTGSATKIWSELGRLTLSAQRLGLSVPRMSLGPENLTDDFTTTMPAIVDFMDSLDSAIQTAAPEKADAADDLKEEAALLLGKVLAAEKLPREIIEEGAPPSAAPAQAGSSAAESGSASAFQAMMGGMMPGMLPFPNPAAMFAALDPVEIERKIDELRIIEGWLAMSLNMTQMSIKTLELQHASLEALHAAHAPRAKREARSKKD